MTRLVFSLNGLFTIDCCPEVETGVFAGASWEEGTGRRDDPEEEGPEEGGWW